MRGLGQRQGRAPQVFTGGNVERGDRLRRRVPLPVRCVIMFTPRSGSSRVTDILAGSGALGRAGECFNPEFLPKMAAAFGARTLEDYVALLVRGYGTPRVFTCQATYRQAVYAFGSGAEMLRQIQPTAWVWLIRRDIVAQAVSAARMIATGVAHDTGLAAAELSAADAAFGYNGAAITRNLFSIRDNERRTEAMFARHRLAPLRLSYERLAAIDPGGVAGLFARHLGVPLPEGAAPPDRHRKLGTGKSAEIAERYRRRNRWLLAAVERGRRPMLARLDEAEAGLFSR